jgi:hypothetical protein
MILAVKDQVFPEIILWKIGLSNSTPTTLKGGIMRSPANYEAQMAGTLAILTRGDHLNLREPQELIPPRDFKPPANKFGPPKLLRASHFRIPARTLGPMKRK